MPPPGTAPMSDETPSTGPTPPASGPLSPEPEVPGPRPPSEPAIGAAAETPFTPPAAQSLPPAPPLAAPPPAPPLASPAPQGVPAAATEGTPASSRRRWRLVGTIAFGVIVLALLGAIGYVAYQRFLADPTKDAAAGDCLADLPAVAVGDDPAQATEARIVECTDPAAAFVVEGRLDSVSEDQASGTGICGAYDDASFLYSVVPPGGTGYVLCLRELAE